MSYLVTGWRCRVASLALAGWDKESGSTRLPSTQHVANNGLNLGTGIPPLVAVRE